LREPPSKARPEATAIASSRVDFPEPFSPTKKTTRDEKRSFFSDAIVGTENGKLVERAAVTAERSISTRSGCALATAIRRIPPR
jgi:hypothetical protein